MAKLDLKKAKAKFEEYLNEIENLKGVPYEGGGDVFRDELDEKIRSLISLTFDDAKEKLSRYQTNPAFSLSTGMSLEEIRNARQDYHESKLALMKKFVVGHIEELELVTDFTIKNETDEIDFTEIHDDKFQGIMKIFVSHKFIKDDQKLALTLRNELKKRNMSGYLAESKKEYGLLIGDKIRKEIEQSDYVIGIITKNSENSASLNQELGYALGLNVPVILLVEEDIPQGVLIHGREIEEFTHDNFEKHCVNVVNYILERGKKRKPISDIPWLRENIYEPLYNSLMKFMADSSNIEKVPPNPWLELKPSARLKTEPEIADLFNKYEIELQKWRKMLQEIRDGFEANLMQLGEIIRPAFRKASMLNANDMIILNESSSQEPRHWIDAFDFILFDDSITNSKILYDKLIEFAELTRNGHRQYLEYWKQHYPIIFESIVEVLPAIRQNLKITINNKQLLQQRENLMLSLTNIISILETKLIQS